MAEGRLQRELNRRNPFETPEQEAVLNLLRTGDLILNRFGRLFSEHNITDSQYNVLKILRDEGQPMPSLGIAGRMVQVVPAITGLIDRLEAKELVVRRRCVQDRRVVYVEITPLGMKLLAELDQPVLALHTQMVGKLSQPEVKQLSRLLEKAREVFSQ
ncbi:MAG: MarR family transcriptional regulator [Planctomycetota bacterium]|nr:MarR family transcriptional regulator [Planctomycetota bacterium]